MTHHSYRRRARLQLEHLEDRCTPSATLNPHSDQILAPPSDGPPDYLHEGSTATSHGNVISAFAREAHGVRVLWGESTIIDGARAVTWALVSPQDNTILAVGVTFSLKLAEEMPEPGSGPAGAIAALDFPALVQETTFFNHLEIQSNLHGHEAPPGSVNPERNRVPHFDFHFYAIPEEQVWGIPALRPPLPAVPAERLPAGYTQPGPSILQMGRHSAPVSSLTDPGPLSTIMILGYLPNGSQMHFLEPMISQEVLLARQDFTLPVPMPRELGRASPTLYPTRFEALFQGNAYSFVCSDFVTVPSAASAVNPAAATSLVATADRPASTVRELPDFSQLGLLWGAGLGSHTTPSAFQGLDVAAEQFIPAPPPILPPKSIRVAPVLAANSSEPSSETLLASLHMEDVLEDLAITSKLREV